MKNRVLEPVLLLAIVAGFSAAQAQIPGVPGGTGLPDVSKMGAGNAAGVLSYCVKNKFLGGSDATSVLGGLTRKPEVKQSKDYSAGEMGQVLSGKSKFSLDSAPKQVKTKVCDMVLKQGKSLI